MTSISKWVVLQQNKEAIFWGSTAGLIIHPRTRSFGWQAAKFGTRATGNVAVASTRALFGTTLVRGGSLTFGSASAVGASAVGLGYVVGAAVGSGISYKFYGDAGARDALHFYSNPFSATADLFD